MDTRRTRAAVLGVLLGLVSVAASAGVADAHDPIIVTDRQVSAADGPLLPDGTISFALYGVVGGAGDTRGFRVQFAEGDRLAVSLLVPAREPEQGLGAEELPLLEVQSPDGTDRTVRPTERVVFDEPFSGTSYVRLASLDEPALAGEYRVTVVGRAPSRFTVSVGTEERFGTPVEQVDDRSAGVAGVQQWYATPPAAVSPAGSPTAATSASPETTVAPTSAAAPAAAVAATTSSLPGASATTSSSGPNLAGSAVFFGALAVIAIGGALLYARRRHR